MTYRPAKSSRTMAAAVASVALLLIGCGAGYWYLALQTYHLATVVPGTLYRAGNRGIREFEHALARERIKTVVSLVDDRELADTRKPQFAQEAELCRRAGIRQIRIPVKLGGWPTSADLQRFEAIVADPANRPVLVHCAQGVRRTGMFVAAYQMTTLHQPASAVRQEVLDFGHKLADLADDYRFIQEYDPIAQAVPTTLPTRSAE